MRFSERIGKKKPKVEIQFDSMDIELRNGIYNILYLFIFSPIRSEYVYNEYLTSSRYYNLAVKIWISFLKEKLNKLPSLKGQFSRYLEDEYEKWDYLQIYDFINFLVEEVDEDEHVFDKYKFIDYLNNVFQKELSGYRFVANKLVPITSEEEINSIEMAIYNSSNDLFNSVNIHLTEALKKISDKNNPDYRNSIKESISAVESICQIILNEPKAELGKALKKLKEKIHIHPSLEQGFSKIYGYTSDSDGIRHALQSESSVMQEDAIFMLVACSAFVNYLIVKSSKLNT
jgi:hypothetical protein